MKLCLQDRAEPCGKRLAVFGTADAFALAEDPIGLIELPGGQEPSGSIDTAGIHKLLHHIPRNRRAVCNSQNGIVVEPIFSLENVVVRPQSVIGLDGTLQDRRPLFKEPVQQIWILPGLRGGMLERKNHQTPGQRLVSHRSPDRMVGAKDQLTVQFCCVRSTVLLFSL